MSLLRGLPVVAAYAAISVSAAIGELPTGVVPASESRNQADRVEAFRDWGLGLFVHWSVDVQYGAVISHSLVGADAAYQKRYFEETPKTFNRRRRTASG